MYNARTPAKIPGSPELAAGRGTRPDVRRTDVRRSRRSVRRQCIEKSPECVVDNHGIERLRENIRTVFLGHSKAVDLLLIGLLARGHVLIEDVPGVGKTVLAKSLARSIDCKFTRIQLTPDLLPSDVLGVSIFNTQTQQFDFKPGPIFANIVLADEINRTTPRTQSALLEAMSEEQVSVENQTVHLDRPFMV